MDSKIDKSGSDPFSVQLRAGFHWLRFEGGLEQDYRTFILKQQRRSTQICAFMGLAIWVGFAAVDMWRFFLPGLGREDGWLTWMWLGVEWLGVRWFLFGFIVLGLLYEFITRKPYDWLSWGGYIFFGIMVSKATVLGWHDGGFTADGSVIVLLMAAFLPLGFPFRRALVAAIMIALFTTVLLWFDESRQGTERFQLALIVLLVVPVAAMGGYLREYSERYNYLLMGVLNQQAGHDPLTGLSNRRQLSTHAAAAFLQAERTGEKVSIVVADIDYFKQYNDLYGHPEGDRVLVHVSSLLARAVRRPLDLAARVGGEEFCLFFFGADAVYVEQVLHQMALALKALSLPHEGSPFGLVSFSAGMAERGAGEDFYALFSRADAALYEAKRQGRNRIGWA